jgi:signal transduction histidine kinase
MNPLRSVSATLSLALLLVVAGALAIVFLVVAPSLESRLVSAKLSALEKSAPTLARQYREHPFDPDFFDNAAATANARVALFRPLSQAPPALSVVGDSRGGLNSADLEEDPIALEASLTLEPQSGVVERRGVRFAEAAAPVSGDGSVLLLSASLQEPLGEVGLVRERLLVAGGIVLFLVLIVGYAGAWLFARRIRKLERAAERIASGRFDQAVVDLGADEVGELARAFERMRVRLAQLDRARREFIANASHELRTPLFSLGGFLELLDDEELDEATRREFLATMREQVSRLEKLATELLDLSRLDAGQIELRREPVVLDELAQVVAEEFAAVARQTGHRLEVEGDEEAAALADEQRALQIARVLVENAIVHTPPGTTVRLRTARSPRGVSLAVEDDGPGIPAEEAPHVFERFYRVEGAQASGSGLGLAIARELARLMGGSLHLESEPGRTVFRLLLPALGRLPEPRGRELAVAEG